MSKSDEPTASGCLAALIGILVILPIQVRRRTEYLAKLNALCEKEKALLEDQKKHDREMFEAWKKEKDLTFASLYGSKHLPTKGDA